MLTALVAAALTGSAALGAPVLTLDEAMTQAARNNLDLAAAQSRIDQSRELVAKARSAYLPQVTLGAQYTFNSVDAKFGMPTGYTIRDVGIPTSQPFDPSKPPDIGNPPGQPTNLVMVPTGIAETAIQEQHQLGAQLQVTQGLFLPAVFPAVRTAHLAETAARLGHEAAKREILMATAQLYYSAASLREARQVQARLLETYRAHEEAAAKQVASGNAPKMAELRARIERVKAEQELERTDNAYAGAISALATLMNRPPDFDVTRPTAPPFVPSEAQALERSAMEERPDLEAARVQVEIAETQRESARKGYLPNVLLVGNYNLSNTSGFTGEYGFWNLGVALSWNLFDGGLREAELRESAARLSESRANLAAAEARARDELRRALLDLASARANAVKADEQLALARENARLVQASFELQAATYLEVIDANAALAGAELSAINEALQADLAQIQIARAAGLLTR